MASSIYIFFALSIFNFIGPSFSTPTPECQKKLESAKTMLETLNQNLVASPSATVTLKEWCEKYKLAPVAEIKADRIDDKNKPKTLPEEAKRKEQLNVKPNEEVKYRQVALKCGDLVLSEADNWYIPDRLTKEINDDLEHNKTPFGTAVKPLGISRTPLSQKFLWTPSEKDCKGNHLEIPKHVLEHRAIVNRKRDEGVEPISLVIERYTNEMFTALNK